MGSFAVVPDEMFEWSEPSAFDDAKQGWHEGAISKLSKPKLVQVLNYLGADTVKQGVEHVGQLNAMEYVGYLQLLEEDVTNG